MAIRHEFKFTPPEGQRFISFDKWAKKLPPEENAEWSAACVRQHKIRDEYIQNGQLQIDRTIVGSDSYIWDENAVEQKPKFEYKEYDDKWLEFWNRYLEETGTKFEIVETKI